MVAISTHAVKAMAREVAREDARRLLAEGGLLVDVLPAESTSVPLARSARSGPPARDRAIGRLLLRHPVRSECAGRGAAPDARLRQNVHRYTAARWTGSRAGARRAGARGRSPACGRRDRAPMSRRAGSRSAAVTSRARARDGRVRLRRAGRRPRGARPARRRGARRPSDGRRRRTRCGRRPRRSGRTSAWRTR